MTTKILILVIFILPITSFAQECICGKNIGSYSDGKPDFTFTFSNSATITVCGYVDEMESDTAFYISEFSAFTCNGKKALASYSAIHSCKMIIQTDSIFINRIKGLYDSESKSWNLNPLAQRVIYSIGDSLDVTKEYVVLSVPKFDGIEITTVLNSDFKNMNYDEISYFLGQLEILALNQNQDAVNILFSSELEIATNAASTEYLFSIRETYNWVILGVKNEKHWW
jgi:hypothetical protein